VSGSPRSRWWLIALAVVALALPQFAEPIVVHTAIEILIMALFAMSFNLLFDGAGLLTFGHGCYYGVGAYTAALLMTEIGMPMLPAMFAAMVMGGLVALVFGYFCVRLTGVYFSILTLAFAQLMFSVFQQSYTLTGGDLGILDIQPPAFLVAVNNYYYFTLVVVGVSLWLLWRILHSPFGRTLHASRDSVVRTQFIGINVRRYRLAAFVIAGVFASLAGALFAPFNRAVAPFLVSWVKSSDPVLMTLLGGAATFWGPVVGAAVFTTLHEVAIGYTTYWLLLMGGILLVGVLFLPGGILGFLEDRFRGAAAARGTKMTEARGASSNASAD
jgi:branched-chain amino acid transport system permease protein